MDMRNNGVEKPGWEDLHDHVSAFWGKEHRLHAVLEELQVTSAEMWERSQLANLLRVAAEHIETGELETKIVRCARQQKVPLSLIIREMECCHPKMSLGELAAIFDLADNPDIPDECLKDPFTLPDDSPEFLDLDPGL